MIEHHDDGPASTPGWGSLTRMRDAMDGRGGQERPYEYLSDQELRDGLAELRAGRPAHFRPNPHAPPPPRHIAELTDEQLRARMRGLVSRMGLHRGGSAPGPVELVPLKFIPGRLAPGYKGEDVPTTAPEGQSSNGGTA